MPNTYTTLAALRSYLNVDTPEASALTADDAELLRLINRAARAIDKYARRAFYPRRETRYYSHPRDTQVLRVDDDLVEVIELATYNGASPLPAGVLLLRTGDNWNLQPYDRVELDHASGSALGYLATQQKANHLDAFWCYHEAWGNAWTDLGTSLAADYAAGAPSLLLAGAGSAGAGASDVNYDYPRLAVGDLLRIGDQFFQVAGGGSLNTIVRVQPAANGTAAASHASGASLAKFAPEPDIVDATIRLAAWKYGQRDTPYQTRQGNSITGDFSVPESWPGDVRDKLRRFRRDTIYAMPG